MATGVAIIGMTKMPRSTPRKGKRALEDQRREGAEDQRQDDGERRVDEGVPDGLGEARVGGEAAVVGEAGEAARRRRPSTRAGSSRS